MNAFKENNIFGFFVLIILTAILYTNFKIYAGYLFLFASKFPFYCFTKDYPETFQKSLHFCQNLCSLTQNNDFCASFCIYFMTKIQISNFSPAFIFKNIFFPHKYSPFCICQKNMFSFKSF